MVGDVETGYDADHPLMFLLLDLFLGFLVLVLLRLWLLRGVLRAGTALRGGA